MRCCRMLRSVAGNACDKEQLLFYDDASLRDALALSAALCGRSFRLLERGEGLAANRRGDGEKSSVSREGARRGVAIPSEHML